MQVPNCRSTFSARGKQESCLYQGRPGRKKGALGEKRGVRQEGEQLVREAEELMRRGVEEEEEDLNWVRKRMEKVQMSSPGENLGPQGNPGETLRRAGNKRRSVKVPGSEFSRARWGECRQNSEPTSRLKGRGLSRVVRN